MAPLGENSPVANSPSKADANPTAQYPRPTDQIGSRKQRRQSSQNGSQTSTTAQTPPSQEARKVRRTSTSRWNAQKHGILSKTVVLKSGELGEKQEDFDFLLEELRQDLQPVGVLEEMQVELIATSYWRLRRALKSESGLLDYYAGENKVLDALKRLEEFDANCYATACATVVKIKLANRLVSVEDLLVDPAELERDAFKARQKLRNSSFGLKELIGFVKGYIEMVNEGGFLEERYVRLFSCQFGLENPVLAQLYAALDQMKEAKSPEGHEGNEKSGIKERCLAELTWLRDRLQDRLTLVQWMEEQQVEALTRAKLVPDDGAMDRVLRYQTTLQRDLHRAMQQLERLQRMRKGEHVPAPATISFT